MDLPHGWPSFLGKGHDPGERGDPFPDRHAKQHQDLIRMGRKRPISTYKGVGNMPFGLPGATIADHEDHVLAYGPATPSAASPKYINLKNVQTVEVIVSGLNGSTVTGSAITLQQAQDASGTNAKALGFAVHYKNEDATNANSMITKVNTSSNTFTTVTTNTKGFVYRIPVNPQTLDTENGFYFLQAAAANAVNTTLSISYRVFQKYSGNAANNPNLMA